MTLEKVRNGKNARQSRSGCLPKITVDRRGGMTACRTARIHPAHNADDCHYSNDVPGDLPNFYVEVQNWDGSSEILDDLQTDDDLEAWLQELQSTGATTIRVRQTKQSWASFRT